ncbi:hypothetical protein [Mesorhizobium sp. CCNWLW179-1]|uniref:hypothetical protein n=1 Tax=Mesorhizobium sp. CCNWLW179-1 TaxID=3136721 RepID=UPI00310A86EA
MDRVLQIFEALEVSLIGETARQFLPDPGYSAKQRLRRQFTTQSFHLGPVASRNHLGNRASDPDPDGGQAYQPGATLAGQYLIDRPVKSGNDFCRMMISLRAEPAFPLAHEKVGKIAQLAGDENIDCGRL